MNKSKTFKKDVVLLPHFVPVQYYGGENQNYKPKRKADSFHYPLYQIKLINYQYARKPITVLKSRLRSSCLPESLSKVFSYLVRVACHSKNGFTFNEP